MRKLAGALLLGVVFGVTAGASLGQAVTDPEVAQLDLRLAEAVVGGDTSYVAAMTADDFVMVHGDAWTHGGQPLLTDGKDALLNRTTTKYYETIEHESGYFEMHGDVAITHGRYFSHTAGGNDPARAWFSVRFQRVYAKRAGAWQYVSHRTVHGPIFGANRDAVHYDADQASPATGPAARSPERTATVDGLLALEREIGAAIVRGDTQYFDRVTAPDFVMFHGDGWTRGDGPALVDDKASFMPRVASKSYAVHDYDVQKAELHGDVAITYGRYIGHIPSSPPERRWFYVWYEKVYAKRDGQWIYLSHRTVDGAHYAQDRALLRLQ